jgi:hypothetical protein
VIMAVEAVFLHLLVKCLAADPEAFIDGFQASAMRRQRALDQLALVAGDTSRSTADP